MNYTQLYKKANMRKAATAAQIYKVATLLKRAEQKEAVDPSKESAGLGTWNDNLHEYWNGDAQAYLQNIPVSNRNYFQLLRNMNPAIRSIFKPSNKSGMEDISRDDVDDLRNDNARRAVERAFKLPSSFRNNALYELAKKIGKWKEQQWKETGAVPTKMSPELESEYNNTVKGIVLPEGRKTQEQRRDQFYKWISDANKRGRHSNMG